MKPVRADEHTAERSMFFIDRDGFPLALHENWVAAQIESLG